MNLHSATLTLVVAYDAQRGIGLNNALPWHLREDLQHFKRTTSGHPIIMGRKTFDSIGRPLPNRRNIVVTRNPEWRHEGVETASSLDEAVRLAGAGELMVIGGAQIFSEALPHASRMVVTEIDRVFNCDTFFPAVDPAQWKEDGRESHYSEENGCAFAFVTYRKK